MASFPASWPTLRDHEGRKYTDHRWDPGGATKYGITLRYAKEANVLHPELKLDMDKDGDVDKDDIKLLDEPTAMTVYRLWWDEQKYGLIEDQQVATKVMDMSINMGPRQAHKYVQMALNSLVTHPVGPIKVDGLLGTKESIPAINRSSPIELLMELAYQQKGHYLRWLAGFTKVKGDREGARRGLLNRALWPFKPPREDVA